jgi:hypothetical protein
VSVTPDLATLAPNGKLAFGATVDGSRTQPVTWIVLEGPPGGAVGSTGAYRAPNKIGDFHLIALSPASVGGMATIEVR